MQFQLFLVDESKPLNERFSPLRIVESQSAVTALSDATDLPEWAGSAIRNIDTSAEYPVAWIEHPEKGMDLRLQAEQYEPAPTEEEKCQGLRELFS